MWRRRWCRGFSTLASGVRFGALRASVEHARVLVAKGGTRLHRARLHIPAATMLLAAAVAVGLLARILAAPRQAAAAA